MSQRTALKRLLRIAAVAIALASPFGVAAAERHDVLGVVLLVIWACSTVAVAALWPCWWTVLLTAAYLYLAARISIELIHAGLIDAVEESDKFRSDDTFVLVLIPMAIVLQTCVVAPLRVSRPLS